MFDQKHKLAGLLPLVLGLVLVLAAVLALHRYAGEPRCQGRPLSGWLAVCAAEYRNPQRSSEYWTAAAAVQQIGTNAVPCLVKWLEEGAGSENSVDGMIGKLVAPNGSTPSVRIEGVNKKRDFAMAGFYALGGRAVSAAPKLIELMIQTNSPDLSAAAGEALGATGSDGVAVLVKRMAAATPQQHLALVQRSAHLANLGTNAAPLVPILVADLQREDGVLVQAAVSSLGSLAIEPGVVVPALTNCLSSRYQSVRSRAARSLGNYGRAARESVPALVMAQGDPSAEVRIAVTNALGSIVPLRP